MTPELDKQLCEKYPLIFADRDKSAMESCMFWGLAVGDGWYNLIDTLCATIQDHIDWSIKSNQMTKEHNAMVIAARAGDLTLFNNRFTKISPQWRDKYLNEMLATTVDGENNYGLGIRADSEIIPQLVADQVKEKFAGLRFYHHGGDEFCDGVIRQAAAMSVRTCEECGAPGTVGGRSWIKTLCDTHRKKLDEEQYSHHKEPNE